MEGIYLGTAPSKPLLNSPAHFSYAVVWAYVRLGAHARNVTAPRSRVAGARSTMGSGRPHLRASAPSVSTWIDLVDKTDPRAMGVRIDVEPQLPPAYAGLVGFGNLEIAFVGIAVGADNPSKRVKQVLADLQGEKWRCWILRLTTLPRVVIAGGVEFVSRVLGQAEDVDADKLSENDHDLVHVVRLNERAMNGEGQVGTWRRQERGSKSPMYRRGNLGAQNPMVVAEGG